MIPEREVFYFGIRFVLTENSENRWRGTDKNRNTTIGSPGVLFDHLCGFSHVIAMDVFQRAVCKIPDDMRMGRGGINLLEGPHLVLVGVVAGYPEDRRVICQLYRDFSQRNPFLSRLALLVA